MDRLKTTSFWAVVVVTLLVPFILNITIFQFTTPITFHGDWLSFWGNYSGGILSAIVAYLVANSQIRKQQDLDLRKDKYTRTINQLPALVRIEIELEKYIKELHSVKEQRESFVKARGGIRKNQGDDDISDFLKSSEEGLPEFELNEKHYYMELPLSDNTYYLERIEDIDLHIDLITCFNFYKDFADAINYNIVLADKKRNELRDSLSDRAILGEISVSKLQVGLEQEGLMYRETSHYYDKKKKYWEEFYEKEMLYKFEEVFQRLRDEIETVKQIKKTGYTDKHTLIN